MPSVIKTESGYELIPYNDELTKDGLKREHSRLKAAFPSLDEKFYQILIDRIQENKYTDKQLHDAVNHVIDNCTYPTPTIANIMSYKNRVKLFTYSQICNMVETNGRQIWNEYQAISFPGLDCKVWATRIDIEKYNLNGDNE